MKTQRMSMVFMCSMPVSTRRKVGTDASLFELLTRFMAGCEAGQAAEAKQVEAGFRKHEGW